MPCPPRGTPGRWGTPSRPRRRRASPACMSAPFGGPSRGELPATKRARIFQIAPEVLAQYQARHQHSLPPPSLLRLVEQAVSSAVALPTPLTPFLGREREVAAVAALMTQPDLRLLTLTGPGGTGKTRLALRVAVDLTSRFADGVAFVPLAAVADPL